MWGLLVVAGRQLSRRYRSLLLLLVCVLIYAHVVTRMVRSGGSSSSAKLDLAALPPSASSHALDLYPDQETLRLDLGGDDWTVRSEDGMAGPAVAAVVPGGVYSDLQAAGKLGENDIYYRLTGITAVSAPLFMSYKMKSACIFRYNDDDFGWVAETNWIYEKTFFVPESFRNYQRVVLNFDGIDTVADVLLNNRNIGNTENMFVRYVRQTHKFIPSYSSS